MTTSPVARALTLAALIALFPAPRAVAQTGAATADLTAQVVSSAAPTASAPIVLSLGDAARIAARQSATAQVARLRASAAGARARQRRADLLPNLSALGTQSDRTFNTATLGIDFPSAPGQPPFFDPDGQVLGPVHTIDLRGRASMPLLELDALARYRGAAAAAEAGDADAANAAQQAAAGAAVAYLRALRADAQLQARTADSVLAGDLLGIARDQLKAGVGIALDVTRAQSQASTIRAQLILSRNDRDRSRLDLLRTLNLPLNTPIQLSDSLAGLPAEQLPGETDAIDQALRGRADLLAADRQLVAAERAVTAIRAERLPSVAIFGDQGVVGKNWSHLLNTYTWGLQLSLPLFDGFRREARIEEQRATAREVDVRLGDLRQQTAIEVRGALLDLASAREQVDAARERLRFADQEVAQARERFRAGVSGNADVIAASLSLNAARTLVVDALTAYQSARVSLARAQGAVTRLR
jgi:outer membrane protein